MVMYVITVLPGYTYIMLDCIIISRGARPTAAVVGSCRVAHPDSAIDPNNNNNNNNTNTNNDTLVIITTIIMSSFLL